MDTVVSIKDIDFLRKKVFYILTSMIKLVIIKNRTRSVFEAVLKKVG